MYSVCLRHVYPNGFNLAACGEQVWRLYFFPRETAIVFAAFNRSSPRSTMRGFLQTHSLMIQIVCKTVFNLGMGGERFLLECVQTSAAFRASELKTSNSSDKGFLQQAGQSVPSSKQESFNQQRKDSQSYIQSMLQYIWFWVR